MNHQTETTEPIHDPAQLPLFLTAEERADQLMLENGLRREPKTAHGHRVKARLTPATHTRVYAHLPSRHLNAND